MAWYTEGVQYMLSLQGHYTSDYSKVQGQWVDNGSAGAEAGRVASLGRWLGHDCNDPEMYDCPRTVFLSAH